ncbi:MAG TPA: hypothetical protein VJB15_02575 [Rhodothermia bacterium]|nr:hypothetical protein [Rhodothermia bacterium]
MVHPDRVRRELRLRCRFPIREEILLAMIVGVCVALTSTSAEAQSLRAVRWGIVSQENDAESAIDRRGPSLVTATLASAVLPGAGQALLRTPRAFLYLGAEALGWIRYTKQQRDGDRSRTLYRELSRSVARASFSPDGPDGDWDYYERMEKFAASGAFDVIPGGNVDPEPDPSTYNGSIWLLARQTYWRDPNASPAPSSPEFQSALTFYTKRAVPADLRWSWMGAADGFQQYRSSIAASNNAFKRAEQTAGLIIANHLLSAVDAYVTVRVRSSSDSRGGTSRGFVVLMPVGH